MRHRSPSTTTPALPIDQCDSACRRACHLDHWHLSAYCLPSHNYTMLCLPVSNSCRMGVLGYTSISYVCMAHSSTVRDSSSLLPGNSGCLAMRHSARTSRKEAWDHLTEASSLRSRHCSARLEIYRVSRGRRGFSAAACLVPNLSELSATSTSSFFSVCDHRAQHNVEKGVFGTGG